MRRTTREVVRQRYAFRCGYCGIQESDAGSELTIDHYQPRSQNGTDAPENLVYCCHPCNEFKGDHWDPTSLHRVLHPERDDLDEHLELTQQGVLKVLTDTGAFHVERLRLNRPPLVAYRRERLLRDAAVAAQQSVLSRLTLLESRIDRLETEIHHLRDEPGE